MTQFAILTGKKLATAIAGFGKVAATFSQSTHQLAYSAINHVELHHDACYVQSLYEKTPVNYRAAIVSWATAFGKVTFDAKALTFSYAKGKKSDLSTALTVSPADFQKAKGKGNKGDKALMERVESMLAKVIGDEKASRADKAFAKAMQNSVALYKRSLEKAAGEKKAAPRKPRKAATGKAAAVEQKAAA